MKKRHYIVLALLLVLLLFCWWMWRVRKAPEPSVPAQPAAGDPAPEKAPATGASASSSSANPPSKRELMGNLLSNLNHKDIEFYGKVVDQSGVPLPDVTVNATVIYNTGLTSGMARSETRTDSQGLFSITGMQGRTLGLSLDKPGYEYDGEKGPFHFTELVGAKDRYVPDQKNPVVLVMWKLQGAEPMIHFDQRDYPLPSTGQAVRVDLSTGKRVATGGDVVFTLSHAEAAIGQRLQRYPWKAEITAPDGGLIESTSRRMYLAPENGYRPSIVLSQEGQEPDYEIGTERTYYLKTGGGRYARIRIHLTTDTSPQDESYVVLTWWLNPSGSRNLEFDAERTARVP